MFIQKIDSNAIETPADMCAVIRMLLADCLTYPTQWQIMQYDDDRAYERFDGTETAFNFMPTGGSCCFGVRVSDDTLAMVSSTTEGQDKILSLINDMDLNAGEVLERLRYNGPHNDLLGLSDDEAKVVRFMRRNRLSAEVLLDSFGRIHYRRRPSRARRRPAAGYDGHQVSQELTGRSHR